MKLNPFRPFSAALVVAAAALGGTAHAGNVSWSVGIHAAPGLAIGVGSGPFMVAPRPVYVAPAPVYVAPAPVYVAPRPVRVVRRPVVLAPRPVYVAAPVVVQYARPVPLRRW